MASVTYTPTGASTSSITVTTLGAGGSGLVGGAGSSVTIPSSHFFSSNSNGSITTSANLKGSGLYVTSDAEFEGNIKWKGRDLGKVLETIEKRLAILEPNPKKLDKFEALQKAYEHYKLLEALCHLDEDE